MFVCSFSFLHGFFSLILFVCFFGYCFSLKKPFFFADFELFPSGSCHKVFSIESQMCLEYKKSQNFNDVSITLKDVQKDLTNVVDRINYVLTLHNIEGTVSFDEICILDLLRVHLK